MADKRKPQTSPGPAISKSQPNDDFTLTPALYYDAIHHYDSARIADASGDTYTCDRFKRSSLLAAFSFFEVQLNQIAFAYADTHRDRIGQIEIDILEEMETVMDDRGDIIRKNKLYRTESRFSFLAYFLTGQDFDRSGKLWHQFQVARKLRDRWTHPKPPFDTWSLSLSNVYSAITVTRDLFIELSEMMDADPPLWLKPVDDVLDEIHRGAG